MTTEFKHCYEKDLIAGYAPDMNEMKRRVRDQDKALVQSWHSGEFTKPGQKAVKAELKQSFNNIREMQQKKEESVIASLWTPVARLLGIA